MAHCINIKSKEYIELAKQSVGLFNSNPTLNQKELKARISVWQEYNNTDNFPTLNDIKDKIIINNSSLGVEDNSLLFKKENEIRELKKKLINKDNVNNITKILGLISENNLSDYKSFLNSLKFITSRGFNNYSELTDENKRNIDYQFFNIFNSLFNSQEKNEVLKWISSKNSNNWLNSFREIVDEYLTTNGIYETDNKLINNRLKLLNESIEELNNNGLSLMNSYHSIKNRNKGNKIKKLTDSEKLQINNLRNINKTKLFNDMNIMKSSEVLKNILKNNPDSPLTKLLLNKINVNDVDIELVNIDTFTSKDFNKSGNERYGGYYDPVNNKIFLSKSGTDTKSILHEILHALTNHYLHNVDSEYNKDLNNIFNYIKNNKYIVNDQYPLNNIDEFIVGLFTNINFNNDLKKLPPLNSNKKYPNLFREVWDRLLKLIGLKDSNINKNAYEEALNIATNLLNDSTNEIHWLGLNGYNLNDFANIIPLGSKYENRVTKMKRLRDNFSMQEIKDRSKTISTMFSDIITYYQNLPEYSNLNRQEVIKSVTPSQIFQDIKWELEGVLEDYTEELENANGVRKKQLNTWIDNLNKLLDDNNFNSISIYAINEIGKLEGITFYDNSSLNTEKYNSKEENDFGQSALEELAENYDVGENKILDSWQTNYLFTSVGDSLTQKVASVLRFIPEVNKAGKKQQDGLGFDKRLDPQKTKNVILSGLKDMITSKDMIPLLRKLSKSKPWVNGVINKLVNQDGTIKDNELFSQFYQSFRKDLTNMSIVKTIENSDGTLSYTNHIINDVDNVNYYINDWKSNISENIVIAKTKSVYSDNKLIKGNATSNLKKLKELTDEWNSAKTRGDNEEIRKNKEIFINSKLEEIKSQLDAVGISLDENTLKDLLEDSLTPERNGVTYISFNMDKIFEVLKNINDWVTKNSDKEASKLIENNNNNYKSLSRLIIDNQESIIESYVHENGKGYYSYLQPAYIGKLIKNLKSVHGNKERFNKFIEEEFKQYKDFLYDEKNNRYYISWLNDLIDVTDSEGNIIIDNSKNRDKLDQKIQLNFNKTDYSSLDPINYSLSILSEYFSSEDTAWFRVPILSDAPVARYIKFNKYTGNNFKNNVINDLTNLFLYEYNRIKIVKSMNESGTSKINNFNKRGENFVFMPFFNDYINEIEDMGNINEAQALQRIKDIIRENLDKKALEDFEYYKSIGILEKVNNNYKYLKGFNINENNIKEKFDEFYYNDYLSTANIIQLTTTDLAYYKNIEDFQKRNKQINAPGSALNTMAEFNGERIGKDIETTIYLADENVKSNVRNNIINNVLNNNKLSPIEKANIISVYGSNNIIEYDNNIIEVKDSFLHNLEKGFYKKEGKSFKKIEDIDTKSIKGKEFLLVYDNNKYSYIPTKLINVTDAQAYRSLKSYKRIVGMSTGWNNRLENAYRNLIQGKWSMQDYNTIFQAIKPFMYTQHSVETGNEQGTKIKVPVQNKNSETLLLPIFGITKGDAKIKAITQIMDTSDIDVIQFESTVKVGLQGVLDINNMTNRKDIVNYIMNNKDSWQQLSYEDYKIQQPIPDHLQDSEQLFGTQIRKLIMADISPDAIFNIKGFSFTKDQWVKLYQNTNIENILESYLKVKDEFNDINKLQYIIEKELFSNDRYAKDLLNSIQLNDEGNFVLPLHEPSQSTRIQQLLNSIWKSRITKQKIKGGSVVQVTSYGLSEDLNIVWNEDGSIKYYEAYLPWWSDEHGRNFIDQETGEMDYNRISKESPELLEMIAYRIPTEDKYSMIPIRVKGFLPRNAGGNIMLPKEITAITGSDFDIDKMYIMMKEFNYNNKDNKFEVVDYLNKKNLNNIDPKDLDIKQRNNLMIDMIYSVLTNKDTTEKMINPGNFDEQKRTARLISLLQLGYDYNSIKDKQLGELTDILNSNNKSQLDILSTSTQIKLHQQNMTAAKLISIFANHNANHALLQFTDVKISNKLIVDKEGKVKEEPRFILNNKVLKELNQITIKEGNYERYISKSLAGFLAASVDAVKDPVLNYLNLNIYTADAAMLLIRAGYTTEEVGMLLNQPSIIEVVNTYNRNINNGLSKTDAILKVKKIYEDLLKPYSQKRFISKNNPLKINDLANNISLSSDIKYKNLINMELSLNSNISKEDKDRIKKSIDTLVREIGYNNIADYYINQLEVLNTFSSIMDVSQKLSDLVTSMRADTQGGGAGPTIANNIVKLRKVTKNIDNSNSIYKRLDNSNIISTDYNPNSSEEELRNSFRSSPIGFSQAFTSLGLTATKYSLGKYFPHYKNYFSNEDYGIISRIENMTKNKRLGEKELNLIYNDFYAYYLSQFNEFSSENADRFINNFAKEFKEYVEKHPELKELTFINGIKYIKPTIKTPISKLKFINVGKLTTTSRDEIMNEWESLLYGTKEERELAINLFKYCFYCNGFNFGNDSFIHLAPTEIKLSIPNYIRGLNNLLNDDVIDIPSSDTFIDQFYRNHLDNKKLVPEITGISNEQFYHNEEIKNKVDIIIRKEDFSKNIDSLNTELLINSDETEIIPYFSKNINDKKIYYKLITKGIPADDTYSFIRVEPLGMRGNFLEYSFGNNDYYTSVVEQEVENEERYNHPAPMLETDESYNDSFTEMDIPYIRDSSEDRLEEYYNRLSSQEDEIDPLISKFRNMMSKEIELIKEEIEESKNKCNG